MYIYINKCIYIYIIHLCMWTLVLGCANILSHASSSDLVHGRNGPPLGGYHGPLGILEILEFCKLSIWLVVDLPL